jgi:hypothetical protein
LFAGTGQKQDAGRAALTKGRDATKGRTPQRPKKNKKEEAQGTRGQKKKKTQGARSPIKKGGCISKKKERENCPVSSPSFLGP